MRFISVLLEDVAAAKDGLQWFGALGGDLHSNSPLADIASIYPVPWFFKCAKSHTQLEMGNWATWDVRIWEPHRRGSDELGTNTPICGFRRSVASAVPTQSI